jgi:8-oxo-dGTP diphosphatase
MPISDQGISTDRFMLVPRVLIFITRGSLFLLQKGASTKRLWANKYNGIGGHLEPGEDILSAARRELLEETGLTIDLWLCGTIIVETGRNPGIGIYVFTGESLHGDPTPNDEGTLEWFPFSKVKDLRTVEDLPVLISRIQKMERGDEPFHARSFYKDEKLTVNFAEKHLENDPPGVF